MKLDGQGNYSFDNEEFSKFDFKNEYFDEQLNFIVNFDYRNTFNLDLINYKKSKKTNAKVFLNFQSLLNYFFQ